VEEIRLKARAKINLSLDVTGRRDNGYHDVRMVMQSIGIYDSITIRKTGEPGITFECNLKFLTEPESNLAYRAAKLLMDEFGISEGVHIDLLKFIPVAAGMAGGSTDAAAVLYGVNRLFELGLDERQLCERGVKLGADVPFCIMRGTVLSEGIGEILTPLPAAPQCHVIVAKPSISVSTKLVYEALDSKEIVNHPDVDAQIEAIKRGDLMGVVNTLGNVLEDVTIPMHPVITDIKRKFLEDGALGAMMSGSGPTVFAIFDDETTAQKALINMRESGLVAQAYLTEFYNRS